VSELLHQMRRKTDRVARKPGKRLPECVQTGRLWYARLKCPRCGSLCAGQPCEGKYRIFCETPKCGFVTCSSKWDGLGAAASDRSEGVPK